MIPERIAAEKRLAVRLHLAFNDAVPVLFSEGGTLSSEELARCWYAAAEEAADAIAAALEERHCGCCDGPPIDYEESWCWAAVAPEEPKP